MKGSLFSVLFYLFIHSGLMAASIQGKVVDQSGAPVIGCVLKLTPTDRAVLSDNSGAFVFSSVSPGGYTITASHVSFEQEAVRLTVGIEDVSIEMILTPFVAEARPLLVEAIRSIDRSIKTSEELTQLDPMAAQDVPFQLNEATSLTFTSDAGNGVGYTGLRIRGMDATRINVTVNGIPINDQESQGVFWVNMPDLSSSTSSIQVQRGVGSSTNGGQAFGASVNLETDLFKIKPSATVSTALGSFNTQKANAEFSTGLLSNKWAFQGRLSKVNSDGYIDRAWSDLKSYYFSAGRLGEKHSIKFTAFSGQEKTYQAWYGVSQADLETNRTSNFYTYDNQIDNYQQDHYQLHYDLFLSKSLRLSTALHYTKGRGFYEEFREGDALADYNIDPIQIDSVQLNSSDLIRRRWLDNDFFGGIYALVWDRTNNSGDGMKLTLGGGYNQYFGVHFGEVIWAQYAGNSAIRHRYYENDAFKSNLNNYAKFGFARDALAINAEVQVRNVNYQFEGISNDLQPLDHEVSYLFFNPKASVSFAPSRASRVYIYYGRSNREPVRNDFVEIEPSRWPEHETVNDLELGYSYERGRLEFNANLYAMQFKNQLVLNGQLNDVGANLRINVPSSFRRGVELNGQFDVIPNRLLLTGNLTLSQNRIQNFTKYVDQFDADFNWIGQRIDEYENTPISFSPGAIAFGRLTYLPVNRMRIIVQSKYVGDQFLDNTGSEDRMIANYWVSDMLFSYDLKGTKYFKAIRFNFNVFNVLNQLYESNGWTWQYEFDGAPLQDNHYYPQATRNFMAGITMDF